MLHIFTTDHGADSLRKRFRVPKKSADRRALTAIDKGLSRDKLTGDLRRWVDLKYFSHEGLSNPVLWANTLWIFGFDDRLITCFPLPGNLNKDAVKQLRKHRELSRLRTQNKTEF